MKMRKSMVNLKSIKTPGLQSVFINFLNSKISDDEKELLNRYVNPHKLNSRDVLESDLLRVAEESKVLFNLCSLPYGNHMSAEAMAHPQIDDKDPLK
ncbi:MAG: hypothetical protein WCX46_03800, partial [Candidatus Paceibacterota bacterium]